MAQGDINDFEPGTPLRVRSLDGGILAVLIPIVRDRGTRVREQLILRWHPNGQLFAALLEIPKTGERPDCT
jgi:hypothetical protein